MNLRSIRKLFARSPDTHRSVLFWHWPSAPEPKAADSEVDAILDGGFGGVLIDAPPSSHAADYVNETWLTSLMAATSRARKRHDSVWIYDDLGSIDSPAKDEWLTRNPEHAATYLTFDEITLNDESRQTLTESPPLAMFIPNGTKFEQISLESLDLLPYDWTKILVFRRCQSSEHFRFLRAESVTRYLEDTYRPIQGMTKKFFGNTLGVILASNASLPCEEVTLPWDDDLPDLFEQSYGYDLIPVLPHLAWGRRDNESIRFHFWSMIEALFREGFAYTLEQWGEEVKIPTAGFFPQFGSMEYELRSTGPRMPLFARQAFPTVEVADGFDVLEIKQAVSAQRQFERRGVIGVCEPPDEAMDLDQWRSNAYAHLALGVTYLTMDGVYESKSPEQPPLPYLSPGESAWPYVKEHFDRLARLSWIQSLGVAQCDVLVLLPNSSIQCGLTMDDFASYSLSDHVSWLSRELLGHQIDFDYGDETILGLHGRVEHDRILVNQQEYSVVLMPPMTNLRSSTLSLLQDFTMSGGRLLTVGTVPHLLNGEPNPELSQFFEEYATRISQGIDLKDYSAVIDQLSVWDCRVLKATVADQRFPIELFATRRKMDEIEFIHLTHLSEDSSEIALEMTTTVDGQVEYWDHISGTMTPVSRCTAESPVTIRDRWNPQDARTYVFLPDSKTEIIESHDPVLVVERRLEPEWTASRLHAVSTLLTECRFSGHPWGSVEDARSNIAERLRANPEGVIGRLEWKLPPTDPGDGFEIHLSTLAPKDCVAALNDIQLSREAIPTIPFPGYGTFSIPGSDEVSGTAFLDAKWTSPEEITPPFITPVAATDEETGNRVPVSIPVESWNDLGLGDFGHTVIYHAEFQGYERFDESPIYLELDGLHSPSELRLNGKVIEHVIWKPYRVNLRPYWTNGPMRLELEVAGSWTNLLHPNADPITQGLDHPPTIVIYAERASD